MTSTTPPEESRPLRVVVVVAVAVGVIAVAVQQAVPWSLAALAIPALPAVALVAHRHRHGAPTWTKVVAGVLVTLAVLRAMRDAGAIATLDEARFTLAELFVVVQVAHALDLPRRRDLYVSLGSSLVLLAVAGSLSQDMRFGALLLVWAAAALAALVLAHRSSLAEGTFAVALDHGRPARRTWMPMARQVGTGVGVAAAAGAMVLLLVPPASSSRQIALPFRVGDGSGVAGDGLLRNPPSAGGGGRSAGSTYHGLSSRMDLRVRGDLPSGLVMRVQSSAPGMWRGAVFDTYDGVGWTGDEERGRDLGSGPVFRLFSADALGPRTLVSQTYYLNAELPTAIFGVAEPSTLYFPSGVSTDRFGLPRAEATLDDGLVYSVLSTYGVASPTQLRTASSLPALGLRVPPRLRPFLMLPDIPQRVRQLAREITAGATNDYDRVKSLESYLRSTYRYRLDSAVPPEGQDAVDHFLFDAREGFCEQFAAAMTVMARALGIAARVATGYVPGDYNAFTGLYSVHADDAHAWVEVYHPGFGWYAYDPTSSVPAPRQSVLDRVPLVRLTRWAARQVAGLAPVARIGLGLVPAVAILAALRWWRSRRRRPTTRRPAELSPVVARGPATAALARLDAALRTRGSPRRPWETPGELLSRASAGSASDAVDRELFAVEPPDPASSAAAAAVIDRVVAELDAAPAGSGRLR